MYPSNELNDIARRKRELLSRAAGLRMQCCVTGDTLVQPLGLIEHGWALWKRVAPFIEIGALLFSRKKIGRRFGLVGLLLKWGPKLWGLWRNFERAKNARSPRREPVGAAAGAV